VSGSWSTMARLMAHTPRLARRRRAPRLALSLVTGAAFALAAAPASAEPPGGYDAAAWKAFHRGLARASTPAKLPLSAERPLRVSIARVASERRALAATTTPARVLVAARTHADVPGLVRDLRAHGSDLQVYERIGVIALTARSPAALVAAFAGDTRVAAIERNHVRRPAADPADATDPSTGVAYGWAFSAVRAGEALAQLGGGTNRVIAVIDTGVDVTHPDLAGQIASTYNSSEDTTDASDGDGHGTFVTGLIAMVNDNDLGGRGVAGRTKVIGIRADDGEGSFSTESLLAAGEFAIEQKANIINLSLGGTDMTESEARQLEDAYLSDVLPVAAAGNEREEGNPIEYPAAALGGYRGEAGIGLSVGATRPNGQPASFSNSNDYVSVAAPGAGVRGCDDGVFSTVPGNQAGMWDAAEECAPLFVAGVFGLGRYGYSEGTSFATPIVSGVAALAWQAEPRLQSEQVAHVLMRSAKQTYGKKRWNQRTGTGVVDALAAIQEARRYDILAPRFRVSARRAGGGRWRVRVFAGKDRVHRGDRKAGGVRYSLIESYRDNDRYLVDGSRRAISRVIKRRSGRTYWGAACDANGNCDFKRLRLR